MRITNKDTSSSWESGQINTADDFDPERIDDKASDFAFFGF
jgi:hypothetical protein